MENVLDAGSAASAFPRDPAVQVHDKRVPDTSKTPSTPTARPRPRTKALGEQKPHLLHVFAGVEHLVRVKEESILDHRSRDQRLPLNPDFSAIGARAREALARGGLASPCTRGI